MEPDREEVINGRKVTEYWFSGHTVVYVDNHLVETSFEETCRLIREEKEITFS